MQKLTDHIYLSKQIYPADMTKLAKCGIGCIINNRPDGEGLDQPSHMELQKAAALHGMSMYYMPVTLGHSFESQANTFRQILNQTDQIVLAFCRTGNRSAHIWALSQAGIMPGETIIKIARKAGYDISAMAQKLNHKPDTPKPNP